ncbi:cupredoxin domain-containing protein [Methanoregula sp.]|jgi:plastocyanin|uniref:cupredoxin domain-containing protein n=1 Tax=Methanoregula sp. TaxID=2052170 RepID=UPI003C7730D7
MKLLMGFIILLVALVAVTGCTQPASTSAQNTTTAPVTEVTTVSTPVPTTVATMAPVTTTTTKVANVTAPAVNVTTAVVTTVAPVNVTPTATPASGVTTIHITRAGFTPQTDIVLPGTGVSFVNNDNVSLSVMTIGNNTGMFNSGAIIPGAAFPYTFSQNSGTIVYQLSNNANVTGTIIVTSQSNGNHSS